MLEVFELEDFGDMRIGLEIAGYGRNVKRLCGIDGAVSSVSDEFVVDEVTVIGEV